MIWFMDCARVAESDRPRDGVAVKTMTVSTVSCWASSELQAANISTRANRVRDLILRHAFCHGPFCARGRGRVGALLSCAWASRAPEAPGGLCRDSSVRIARV